MDEEETVALGIYERKLAQARREVEELEKIVTAIRGRVKTSAPFPGRRYKGAETLSSFIARLMSDEIERSLDEVERAVADSYSSDAIPSRNIISTRLNEMVRSGKLEKTLEGVYRVKNTLAADSG